VKISDLIAHLERLKQTEGDMTVVVQTLTHLWSPEPTVRKTTHGKVVLLNP
jgi:hypothetical protein